MKKRVLMVNEFSYLATGYSTYGREVLTRLHDSNKFEIAELACYVAPNDARISYVPWKVYPNLPVTDEEKQRYDSIPTNVFGEFRFEDVCLDFNPDIVFDIRDYWMSLHQSNSPYRPFFKHALMPTVDAYPQKEEWLSVYLEADKILTYQDWSGKVLVEQTGGKVDWVGSACPAASEEYHPMPNRQQIKNSLGLPPNAKVIGTVMRNQSRKLFPELFKAFRKYLDISGDDTILYCHTSYPEGYDLPNYIKRYGLSSNVYFTYVCGQCHHVQPSVFQDVAIHCPKCKKLDMSLANVNRGIDPSALAAIMNTFDLYVQYANCLIPGQKVMCNGNWKNIEDIKIDDVVWTHKGKWQKVTDTFQHINNNTTYKIGIHSDYETLELTAEHPLYVLREENYNSNNKTRSFREFVGTKCKQRHKLKEPSWVNAEDIKIGDLIVEKIDYDVMDKDNIDLTDYLSDQYEQKDQKYKHRSARVWHPINIDVDDDFCQWLGLYVADGCSIIGKSAGQIGVTYHIDENKNKQLCQKVMSKFGNVAIGKYTDRKAEDIRCCNKVFAQYMIDNCKKHEYKKLPDWTMNLPLEKQKKILSGLFMGDGCYVANKNVSMYCTISENLANQLKLLFKRVGLTYNVRISIREGNRKPQYLFEIRGDVANAIFDISRSSTRSLNYEGYYYTQVKSIEETDYDGYVYNIEVENDNSYVSKIGTIHNSEACGMPQVEAASCGVPVAAVDYSAMSDVVRRVKGYPIPVAATYTEMATGCERACPDEDAFVKILVDFFRLPSNMRDLKRQETRKAVEDYYSWDKAADKWIEVFDSIDVIPPEQGWLSSPRFHEPAKINEQIANQANNVDYARWLISKVLCEPEKLGTFLETRLIKDLTYQIRFEGAPSMYYNEQSTLFENPKRDFKPFNREMAYNQLANMCHRRNQWEQKRADLLLK